MPLSPRIIKERIYIFNKVIEYLNNITLRWKNCVAVSVGEAMLDNVSSFLALSYEGIKKVIHCIDYHQALHLKHLDPAL